MDIKRTRIVDLLKRTDFGQEVVVKGWVRTKRGSKSVNFIALNDGSTIKNGQRSLLFPPLSIPLLLRKGSVLL